MSGSLYWSRYEEGGEGFLEEPQGQNDGTCDHTSGWQWQASCIAGMAVDLSATEEMTLHQWKSIHKLSTLSERHQAYLLRNQCC